MRTVIPWLVVLLLVAGTWASAASPAFEEALALYHTRRIPEARDAFAKVAAGEPQNPEAWLYLGRTHQRMQQRQEAVDVLERALKLAPTDPRMLAEYGGACLQRAGQLGMSFAAMGLARKGRDALERAVKLSPDTIDYRTWLVEFYRSAPGIVGGGISKAYAQAAEIEKRDAVRGRFVLGSLQVTEKKYAEAFATFESVLSTQPDNYLALYSLGRLAAETGQNLPRGEECLRRCLTLASGDNEPQHSNVHYRLGLIAEKRGQVAQARQEYEATLALQPDFTRAQEALARLK